MTKNKDEQIRELEYKVRKKNKGLLILGFFLAVFALSYFIIGIVGDLRFRDLSQELQSCQDKIPVWTLEIYCETEDSTFRTTMEWDFFDYQEYLDAFDNVDESCEVIE